MNSSLLFPVESQTEVENFINHISHFAQENTFLAYIMLFISAFVENVFPPIPGDTVTLIGAYFVGRGDLNFFGVLFSTTLGSVVGFMTLYLLAYWLEWRVIEKYKFNWVKKSHIDKVRSWFRKYGYRVILANRFLSGVRSVISFAAGLSNLNIKKVFVLSLLSALVWNGIIITAGALIGENWHQIEKYLKLYNQIVIIGLTTLAVVYLVYFLIFKKKLFAKTRGD